MEQKRRFGELELQIMNILWEKKEATVLDVQKSIGDDIAYTTVLTVLTRMYAKGILERKKSGKNYIYFIKVNKEEELNNMLDKIKNSIFGGKAIQLVNYLIDNARDISHEELELISSLIEKRKKEIAEESKEYEK